MTLEQKLLSPTNDFVFKKIFGENLDILRDFLEAVLDLPAAEYKELTVLDPSLEREYLDDKLGVLDVKVTTTSGKVLDIEVQVKAQRAIWKRMLFYTSKMVVEQAKSGYKYEQINRAISILVTNFVMIEGNSAYHNCFRLHDAKTGADYPDSLEINVLEIPKLKMADGTQLGNWMRFFSARTKEDFMQAAQTNPAINEAWGVIKILSGDERARALAESREKARMDFDSYMDDARYEGLQKGLQEGLQKGLQKGLQEGLQKGLQEGIAKVAQNLLLKKMTYADVADATGLSLEEVEKLASGLLQ